MQGDESSRLTRGPAVRGASVLVHAAFVLVGLGVGAGCDDGPGAGAAHGTPVGATNAAAQNSTAGTQGSTAATQGSTAATQGTNSAAPDGANTIPEPATFDPAAQKLDPALVPAYRAMQSGKYDEARAAVDAYLASTGATARRGQAAFVTGMTYHRAKVYTAAIEHFLRALALEPGFAETYYYAGFALFNVGRLDEARRALAVYARVHPDDHATTFARGLVEIEADRVTEAEAFLRRAIELASAARAAAKGPSSLDGDLGRYQARLGDVLVRVERLADARSAFAEATRLRPDSPEVWNKLAQTCERLGDRAAADDARRRGAEAAARRDAAGGAPR